MIPENPKDILLNKGVPYPSHPEPLVRLIRLDRIEFEKEQEKRQLKRSASQNSFERAMMAGLRELG